MRAKYLLVLTCTTLLTMSCVQEPIDSPEFTRTSWEVPVKGACRFIMPPPGSLSEDEVLYWYVSEKEPGSTIAIIEIQDGRCRVLKRPYSARVMRISREELVMRPFLVTDTDKWEFEFYDATTLAPREGPGIPYSHYLHVDGVDVSTSGQARPDLWFYDRAAEREYTLPGAAHGLVQGIRVAIAPGRVLVVGGSHVLAEDCYRPRVQLWSFPEFEKIAEYQATGDLPYEMAPIIFGDLLAFPLDTGKWQVASLRDGQRRFVVGQGFPNERPFDQGFRTLLCENASPYTSVTSRGVRWAVRTKSSKCRF